MICNCGEKCFNYERITKTDDNKLLKERVYKCGIFKETKKEKCNFFIVEKIETVIDKYSIPDVIKETKIIKKDNVEELHKYINLYEKTREKKITNIESLINFNLKLNGYDLFFEENETIEQLKDRIKRAPEKNIKPNTDSKNLVLVEVPEKLRVTITNKRKLKTPGTYYFSSGYINFRKEDDESDIDEDNCFDVDNFSDDEDNFNEEYYD